jgi:integrase
VAVTDLWYYRGNPDRPTKRHGRGKRYRVSVPGHPAKLFRLKKPAQDYEAKLLVEGPAKPRDITTTVGELVDDWEATKERLSPKGRESAKLAAAAVRTHWRDVLAIDVTDSDVQKWLNAEPGSPSRLHKLVQCLGGAMRIAVRRGVIDQMPWEELTVPDEVAREPIYLTPEQVSTLASNCHGWGRDRTADKVHAGYYAPLVWFLATTGARVGEALAMDVRHITKRRVGGRMVWRARVGESKSKVGRDLPVSAKVVKMLDLDRPGMVPLFVTPLGHRVNKDIWRARAWSKALAAAKLDGHRVRIHDLRHTAISWAIADGADVKAVQRMAGHKSAKTTLDVYGHLWDAGLDDVSRRMDGRIR